MKYIFLLATLSAAASAQDIHISVGKTAPHKAECTGTAAIGVRGAKYDATLTYVGESKIRNDHTLPVPRFTMLALSRHWDYDMRILGGKPSAILGITLKGAERCVRDREMHCNRNLPLPFAFHFGAGLVYDNLRLELFHDSNGNLDYGKYHKNYGLNWLSLSYSFR